MALEEIIDPVAVGGRDHPLELLFGDVTLFPADVLGRDDGIDAVWLAVHVGVDPVELELELFGAVGDGAEHTEAARPADRCHDIAAMAKRKNRKLDPQSLANLGLHVSTYNQPSRESVTARALEIERVLFWEKLAERSTGKVRTGPPCAKRFAIP